MIRDLREAARAKRSDILEAGTESQIDAAFEEGTPFARSKRASARRRL
jgi:hypothetical protein